MGVRRPLRGQDAHGQRLHLVSSRVGLQPRVRTVGRADHACCPFTEPAGDRSEPHTAPNGIDPYEKDSEQSMDLTEAELMAILLPGGTALFHLRKATARRRWRARFVSEVQGPIWTAVFSACIPRMGAREQ